MNENRLNILIVDDEPGVRESIGAYLEDFDYMVFLAETAEQGWTHLQKASVDLAIVDMRLPDATGEEWILRAIDLAPNMKYIIFTGSINYLLPENLRALGMTQANVLKKPLLNLSMILDLIQNLMNPE